jgi:excisionase family DNA binding protein
MSASNLQESPKRGLGTKKDVAVYSQTSIRTVDRAVANGELVATRLGRRMVRFAWNDVESWVQSRRCEPT